MAMQPPPTPDIPPAGVAGEGSLGPPPGGPEPQPQNFFQRSFGGIPVWGWLIIVGAGVVIAFIIVPRFMGGGSQTSNADKSDASSGGAGTQELGAYPADTGSVYSGAASAYPDANTLMQALAMAQGAGGSPFGTVTQDGTTQGDVSGGTVEPTSITNAHIGAVQQPDKPSGGIPQYITVVKWTAHNTPWNSYLGGIASHFGVSQARIKGLNPQVKDWKKIQPGQKIRVS